MRYLLLSIIIISLVGILMIPNAFAKEVTVENVPGTGTPGCEYSNSCFNPNPVRINVNDRITWTNPDTAAHTVTSGNPTTGPDGYFDSSLIMAGGSYSLIFTSSGTYDYFCMVHPWMEGTVIVQSGSSSSTGKLSGEHEHASLLVRIFGDKFDFSVPSYQHKNSFIMFEDRDATTIHRHASGITLGNLFSTLNIDIDSECYAFPDGRHFCTNEDYSLKYYINHQRVNQINSYVIQDGDRILISYGNENQAQINQQFRELDSQIIRAGSTPSPPQPSSPQPSSPQPSSPQPSSPQPSSPQPSSPQPSPPSQPQPPTQSSGGIGFGYEWIMILIPVIIIVGVVIAIKNKKKKPKATPQRKTFGAKQPKKRRTAGSPVGASSSADGPSTYEYFECPNCHEPSAPQGKLGQNPDGTQFCSKCGWDSEA